MGGEVEKISQKLEGKESNRIKERKGERLTKLLRRYSDRLTSCIRKEKNYTNNSKTRQLSRTEVFRMKTL